MTLALLGLLCLLDIVSLVVLRYNIIKTAERGYRNIEGDKGEVDTFRSKLIFRIGVVIALVTIVNVSGIITILLFVH